MGERVKSELAERGVYWARYMKAGRPIAYAVDSKGNVVRRLVVLRDGHTQAAIDNLWDYLDLVDPKPQLHLVKMPQLPPTERRAVLEPLDPYDMPPVPGWRRRV
jgi:hypothetical protein